MTKRLSAAHVPELDGIRGVAIAGVMALHFVGGITAVNALERVAGKAASYGLWGVDLFFVLSGFLITGILVDSKGSPRYLRSFYMRRTLRIFPLYYGVLLVLMVLIPARVLGGIDPQFLEMRRLQAWIWPYLTNVYLGSQSSWSIPYISHFWSLAVEEHFYLVWPFVILLASRKTAMRVCIATGLVALGLRIWLTASAPQLLYASVLTPCRLDALCAGAWFALSARGENPLALPRALRLTTVAAIAILAVSAWHAAIGIGDALVLPLRTTFLATFFGLFIYVSTHPTAWPTVRSGLRASWLRGLGKYSYGLYVYHGLVSYALHRSRLIEPLTRVVRVHTIAVGLEIVAGVGISLALAVASYSLFEVRFLALKKHFDYRGDASKEGRFEGAVVPIPT